MDIIEKRIDDYAARHTRSEPALLERLVQETHQTMEYPQMLTGRQEGRLLKLLVQVSAARLALEIGMFTGYSALSIAEGLSEGGRLYTCEVNPTAEKIARRYFAESPFGEKIEIHMGPALASLPLIPNGLDFAFIDADKGNYLRYYEAVLPKLRPGGLMAIDNMLWNGRVLAPQDEETQVIHQLNDRVCSDPRVENVLLTIRDGVQLIRKV